MLLIWHEGWHSGHLSVCRASAHHLKDLAAENCAAMEQPALSGSDSVGSSPDTSKPSEPQWLPKVAARSTSSGMSPKALHRLSMRLDAALRAEWPPAEQTDAWLLAAKHVREGQAPCKVLLYVDDSSGHTFGTACQESYALWSQHFLLATVMSCMKCGDDMRQPEKAMRARSAPLPRAMLRRRARRRARRSASAPPGSVS